jgi:hypothetical protein
VTDKDKTWLYSRLHKRAEDAAKATRLPGWQSGPADAFRHITASAEATRRYGAEMAELLGNTVENVGNFRGQKPSERKMDIHNNEIGRRIGADAKSFEEIVARTKAAIDEAVARDGSGAPNASGKKTPVWLPKEKWREDKGNRDRSNYPPVWQQGGTPEAERVLARPVESWTPDDVRAVQRSKTYWRGDGPDRAAAFAKVRAWYERNTGPVAVRAYTRVDGTHVAGHSRAAPR